MHFLTGREASIRRWPTRSGSATPTTARSISTRIRPPSRCSRPRRASRKYLFGIDFAPRDLRLALVEAAGGRIGTAIDQVLLFCYHYDPATGKYGFVIMNVVRLAGALTVALLAGSIFFALRRERRQRRPAVPVATGTR